VQAKQIWRVERHQHRRERFDKLGQFPDVQTLRGHEAGPGKLSRWLLPLQEFSLKCLEARVPLDRVPE
jgi:hypothetical protein